MNKNVRNLVKASFALALVLTFSECKKAEVERAENPNGLPADVNKIEQAPGPGGGILMQAFYWDVPDDGNWWNTVKGKLDDWNASGISAIWLPPASKGGNVFLPQGQNGMGYDPYDYFDFGTYNQRGSVETRFGSEPELVQLINAAHRSHIAVYADIVLNHNNGGDIEANPYMANVSSGTTTQTYTIFKPKSLKFERSLLYFHPNDAHNNDAGVFGGFPDICHDKKYVSDWLWNSPQSLSKYYKNTLGFDGWRFDFVKGFHPGVVNGFVGSVGGFSVGELWDSRVDSLDKWVNDVEKVDPSNTINASAFDFACYYKMDQAFDGTPQVAKSLYRLNDFDDMLLKRNPARAVTFVSNHDTDDISVEHRLLAYAYIMTHEGYPSVFYKDYEQLLDKVKMRTLFSIHRRFAAGTTTNLWTDDDEYIARRNGITASTPTGLIVYLNTSGGTTTRKVKTNWAPGTRIKNYAAAYGIVTVDANKEITISAPPGGYSIWAVSDNLIVPAN